MTHITLTISWLFDLTLESIVLKIENRAVDLNCQISHRYSNTLQVLPILIETSVKILICRCINHLGCTYNFYNIFSSIFCIMLRYLKYCLIIETFTKWYKSFKKYTVKNFDLYIQESVTFHFSFILYYI